MSTLRVALYARVSTRGQDTTLQHDRLFEEAERRNWEVVGYFEDVGVSGKNDNRPAFKEALKLAGIKDYGYKKSKIDAIVVTKLDRAMRSLTHLNNILNEIHRQDVGLICIDQGFNTSSEDPNSKFFRNVIAAAAEWEREIIVMRSEEGREKAMQYGTRTGRPFGRPQTIIPQEVINDIAAGLSLRKASKKYNIPLSTLSDSLKRLKKEEKCSENTPLENELLFKYLDAKNEVSEILQDSEQFSNEEKE